MLRPTQGRKAFTRSIMGALKTPPIGDSPPREKLRKFGPPVVMRTTLSNSINVAALTMDSPLAVCTVHYLAGSRYEKQNELGATHFLRNCSGTSGRGTTGYLKSRHLQQLGVSLSCSSDRQGISYTMACPRTLFHKVQHYLQDAASRGYYHNWDLDDHRDEIRKDLKRISPEQRLMDLLQKAAFRGALANSVFCRKHQIKDMDTTALRAFVDNNFLNERCSIASVGVPYEDTISFAESFRLPTQKSADYNRSAYETEFKGGFECYDLGSDSDTWLALAVPGCGAGDLSVLLSHCVVAAACGSRNLADGSHRFSRLEQSPLGQLAAHDVQTDYRAFNVSYNDTGIFGIAVRTRASTAWEASENAVNFLRHGLLNLTPAQICVGKRRLMLDALSSEESLLGVASGLVHQMANSVQVQGPSELICMIHQLDVCEILKVAYYIAGGCSKLAVATVGDVNVVPTDVELKDRCCV